MADGFDFSELNEFQKDLLSAAQQLERGKYAKRYLKNEARKLAKNQKDKFMNSGAGAGSGVTEQQIKKSFKAGKVYKYQKKDLSCRGYSGHPLTHLLDQGFIHKGGRDKTGKETFIPGYHFIEKAEKDFEETYYDDTMKFIDKMLDDHGL